MKRFTLAAAAALSLLACTRTETLPTIPEGAIAFRLDPTLLTYHYTDTSKVGSEQLDLELTWLPDQPFNGFNCFGFSPRTPQDTVGTFVFIFRGSNTGLLQRRSHASYDTTTAYFLSGLEGTHGIFITDSNSRLHLNWADGTPGRYFDPSGTMYFSGDTLWSRAELSDKADSVHVLWQVAWTQGGC